jgi:hypothetical protein
MDADIGLLPSRPAGALTKAPGERSGRAAVRGTSAAGFRSRLMGALKGGPLCLQLLPPRLARRRQPVQPPWLGKPSVQLQAHRIWILRSIKDARNETCHNCRANTSRLHLAGRPPLNDPALILSHPTVSGAG